MRYAALGSIPAKRHVQVRANGDGSPLLVEEVMGYEGFSGNESILLHLQSPCRLDQVGGFRPIKREEWVPDAHVHRLADANPVEPGGDPVSGRRLLMWNNDIEVSICKPLEALDGFYRNGEGDEVLYIHRGSGVLRTVFGRVPFRERDYVVIPRGTTHTFELPMGEEQFWICFHTPGEIETPNRYRNRYGQLLEHAPFSQRDFHPPEELETSTRRASSRSPSASATATRTTCSTGTRSTSWAGTATCGRTRSTPTTSSRAPAASTCRRRPTRPSRARTS